MDEIKFGTDGWRAIIAKDYTVKNVRRVAEATARWMTQRKMKQVVIGYDCRFGGQMFSEETASVFGHFGIRVIHSTGFVSTPMVSLAIVKTKSDMGVVITASHNPPSYNGFKLKSSYGGPTIPKEIAEVEELIPEDEMAAGASLEQMKSKGLLEYMDLEEMYMNHVKENFDLDLIRSSGMVLAYDGMYGAGQNVIRRLFPNAKLLHCEFNPSFLGQAPEPILKNLSVLSELIKADSSINLGLANDGDADRIGMFDEDGEFVDSHQILLLLLYYLYKYKELSGKVVVTFSVTDKMKKLAQHFGLDVEITQIGFKYIAEIMTYDDVLVGGEESGGLSVKGHIPERDGIWVGLVVMEFMAKTGKSIKQLMNEIYELVGTFATGRDDLHLSETQKQAIIASCRKAEISHIGNREIIRTETIDGFKYYLSDDEWVMIRPSGTEPVLRIYSEAPDQSTVRRILDETKETLLAG